MPAAATRSPPPRLARQKSTPVTSSTAPTPSARPPSPRVPYFDRYPQRGASDNRSARSAGGSVRSLPNRSPGRMSDAPVAFPTVADPVLPRDDPLVLRAARQRANSSPRTHSPTSTTASPPPRFSASSSLTQATATTYSPPRTPPHERSDSFTSHVSVIAPISGVDVMDALVDVMNADFGGSKNGRDDFFPNHHPKPSASSTSSSRRSKASKWESHHPLYHPPLPEPPPGVKLGGRVAPSSSSSKRSRTVEKAKTNGRSTARRSESDPDEDSGGTQRPRGPSAPPVSRIPVYSSHPPRRASLNKGSSPAATPSRTPSTSQPPPGPPSRSASRSASKSSSQSRPTPAQAIAAASRASAKSHPSHASSPAGASAKSKSSHPSPAPPIHVQIPSEPSSPDEPSTNSEHTSSRDARDVHPGALATACTDAESPAALVPSSSGSSPYATASSSPQNDSLALEDMPSLPTVAGSVRIVQGRNNPSSPPTSPPKAQIVPSITDIIKAHAPEIAASRERDRAAVHRTHTSPEAQARIRSGTQRTATSSRASSGSGYGIILQDKTARWRTEEDEFGYGYGNGGGARRSNSTRDSHSQSHASHHAYRYVDHLDEIGSTRSSMDSVAQEVELTLHLNAPARTRSNISSPPTSASTVTAFPSSNAKSNGLGSSTTRVLMPEAHDERPRRPSTSTQSPGVPFPAALTGASPRLVGASKDKNKDTAMALASYLRSPRLTRLLTLKRKPHSTSIPGATTLQVSLSDVGKETGRPVVVFLGLGCVRYLTALYDEMATALNLRLICIDRWGLGRTSEPIATSSRGVLEWAGVVEEVLDLLDIGHVSVMAHSAGAPYAMAFAQRVGNRVQGDICLLAPWVGGTEAAGYKWLKYVPNALVKTAQAADWKMQGWKLGKPPTLTYDGIGFDAAADDSVDQTRRPSFATSVFSEYDDLADFQGKFDSGSTLCIDQQQQMLVQQAQQQQQQQRGAKRKISKGFLGLWKGGSSTGSNTPSPPTPQRTASGSQPPAQSTPRLKGLKSMGSLKSGYRAGARTRTTSTVTTATTATTATSPTLPHVPTLNVGLGLDWSELRASAGPSTAPAGDGRGISPKSSWSPITPVDSRSTSIKGDKEKDKDSLEVSFASALLAASHAESARGLNADLNTILNHDHKPWGFSYASFSHSVKVWHGDRDERIGEAAVRWMEKMLKDCEVKIVKGAGHSLMTNAKVVVEALESISDAWDRD